MIKKYRVRVEGKDYYVEVEKLEEEGVGVEIPHRRGADKAEGYGITITKEKDVLAPMPARVIKVNCRPGERVKKGELLMIIEAMKMESEILSPIEGVISKVRVSEGSSVYRNETLVVFE